ncbi:hypothetical protein FOVG_19097 [Fusarium oxysporum f. sp. pisi HDV247]|uniref:Uncharacterized protein n=1 Tax=Fusarium oxysporum f. sp. pisi HDV247 TaxID=1080344 RepID=W9N9W6_FUSOX|nr:hypothetical protein FOVG_19097 [Fusarium oxysporum f. sp. pisi HDV247]
MDARDPLQQSSAAAPALLILTSTYCISSSSAPGICIPCKWGFAVNSRLLRQICIGITEKHVREVFQPFNRFDDRSKDAHRNVVFAWQSGHRPLQRGFTYGLDGAFSTTMQPQLLDLYEWASLRWHEFLHLPSRLRPRTNAQIQSDRERILGHQPNVTAEDMGEAAERLMSETQLTPGQKRAEAESRGREQKSPSPGEVSWIRSSSAKRRRIHHIAASPVDEISPYLTQSEAPELFGNLHEPCSHDDIKERRAVIQFLHKYSSARSQKWRLQDRLTHRPQPGNSCFFGGLITDGARPGE